MESEITELASRINELVSRMTDAATLRNYYEQGKKLIKKTRCAPARRTDKRDLCPPDLPDDIGVRVHNRTRR